MEKQYLRSAQPVPNQGMSFTYYEIEGEDQIVRMLTHIPETQALKLYPKPPVKKLFAPERCEAVLENEFRELWEQGQS